MLCLIQNYKSLFFFFVFGSLFVTPSLVKKSSRGLFVIASRNLGQAKIDWELFSRENPILETIGHRTVSPISFCRETSVAVIVCVFFSFVSPSVDFFNISPTHLYFSLFILFLNLTKYIDFIFTQQFISYLCFQNRRKEKTISFLSS